MDVVLIGYRGCGKSTLGRALADRLKARFIDTDERVVAEFQGRSIAEIWQTLGEPAFRDAEARVIAKLLSEADDRPRVLALGGGAVLREDTRQALRASADAGRSQTVYLRASADLLWTRIHADATSAANRPALTATGHAVGGGLDEVREVLARREPTYQASADQVIDIAGKTTQELVERLAAHPARHASDQPEA